MATLRQLAAEAAGTALLLVTTIGATLIAERLTPGNEAALLLGNGLATGAMLFILITRLGPISGAHFNPAVTLMLAPGRDKIPYITVQIIAAIAGVVLVHLATGLAPIALATKARPGAGMWLSEATVTFGLLMVIMIGGHLRPAVVPALVALWIALSIYFSPSTGFANPAVTIARMLSGTSAGIRPIDAAGFILSQLAGAALAFYICGVLISRKRLSHRA